MLYNIYALFLKGETMERIVSKLLIYGDLPKDSILMQLAEVCRDLHTGGYSVEDLTSRVFKQVKRLLELGTSCAFDKNLWHNYLTYLLIMDENPFSLTCEKVGSKDGSVNHFALNDFIKLSRSVCFAHVLTFESHFELFINHCNNTQANQA